MRAWARAEHTPRTKSRASPLVRAQLLRRVLGLATGRPVAALAVLAAAVFALVSAAGATDPGLQYDELLFVNAAIGNPDHFKGFIYSETFGIPTMLNPYIGALKAWVYAPIFSIFGVSVYSVRVPAIVAAAIALSLAVVVAARVLGRWPAAVLALLLASDPVYSAASRADWGPVALSALMRMLALAAYFAYLRRRSVGWLWLAVAALVLGLFNKLDFVWFIAGLTAAAVVVHGRSHLERLRRRPLATGAPLATLLGLGLVFFFELILPAIKLPSTAPKLTLAQRIDEVKRLFSGTVDGSDIYAYMTGSPIHSVTLMGRLFPWVLAACVLAVLAWMALRPRGVSSSCERLDEQVRATAFFLVMFAVMIAGTTLTRQATGPHHIMLLWPLPALLGVCLLGVANTLPARLPRLLSLGAVGLALTALFATQLRTGAEYVRAYRSTRSWSPIWTPEIYAASKAVNASAASAASILSADWGVGNQVFALGTPAVRARFQDEWPSFSTSGVSVPILEQVMFGGSSTIVIFHKRSAQIMPGTTERTEAVLRALGARVHPVFEGHQIVVDLVVN